MNGDGERLCGVLEGDAKEIAILCHGFMDTKDRPLLASLAKAIRDRCGLATLRFDFSGNGESEGRFEDATITKEIEDLQSVVVALQEKGYAVAALVGHSKGATDVLVHQADHGSARKVVALAPKVYGVRGINERFMPEQLAQLDREGWCNYVLGGRTVKISKAYLDERRTRYKDLRSLCTRIRSPVLIVHGTADEVIHADEARDLHAALRDVLQDAARLVLLEEADHNFRDPALRRQMIDTVTGWIADGTH